MKNRKIYSLLLLIFLLLGLSLRIYDLANESIWIDEAISIKTASKANLWQIAKTKNFDFPLYHSILHYWLGFFGVSEFSARFPSVIFGFLILFMSYKIGALIFDAETGILSSLLLALSIFHIQYSQEARMYSLLGFFTLLSMYYFIKWVKEKSLAVSTKYIISGTLLIFTHFFGIFIIFAQNFYFFTLFFLSRDASIDKLKRWIILQAILFTSFVAAALFLFNHLPSIRDFQIWWIPKPSLALVAISFLEYSGSLQLMLIFFVLATLAIINFQRQSGRVTLKGFFESLDRCQFGFSLERTKVVYLLLSWLFLPIIALFLISVFFYPLYWTRYTIGSSLAFYLLAAKGLRNISNKYAKALVIGIIILYSSMNILNYYREVNKENWREVAKYIDNNSQASDLLIFSPGTSRVPFNYYSKRTDLIKKDFLKIYENVNEENIKKLEEMVGENSRVWIILSHTNDPKGLLKNYFIKSFDLLYSKEYLRSRFVNMRLEGFINKEEAGVTLYLFRKK